VASSDRDQSIPGILEQPSFASTRRLKLLAAAPSLHSQDYEFFFSQTTIMTKKKTKIPAYNVKTWLVVTSVSSITPPLCIRLVEEMTVPR
jgi:hypothetical protein